MSTGKTYSTKYLLDSKNNRGAEGQVLSSTDSGIDWVTLSEISGVDGTGTANYLSKWLDANTITNSLVYDNGTNVGIGTTSPSEKLHVIGSSGSALNTQYPAAIFQASDAYTGNSGLVTIGGYWDNTNANLRRGYIQASNSTGSVSYLLLNPNGGNVGIGITTPNNLLNLSKNVADGDVAVYIQNFNSVVGSTNETTSLKFAHGNDNTLGYEAAKIIGGKEGDFESNTSNVKGFLSFSTASGTSLTNSVNNIERMRITGAGNVGIGTTSPATKLSIQSGISASSVDVITLLQETNGAEKAAATIGISIGNNGESTNASDLWFATASGGSTSEALRIDSSGNVLINQSAVTYTNTDNTSLISTPMANVLHVNGSIQMKENNSAIVFGRGTSTFLRDEELAFGWGGGIYMTDTSWLRIRNNKGLYTTGILNGGSLQIGGNTVIDASRNITAGTISATGNVEAAGNLTVSGDLTVNGTISGQLTKKISGDGSATTFTVTHSFGTPHVMTQLLDYGDNGTGATYEFVQTTVKRNSDNAIDVLFGVAPTSSEDYLVLITKMPAIS